MSFSDLICTIKEHLYRFGKVMTAEVRNHVEHLYIQLNALALGHLTPSIMAPQDLKSLLL